MWMDVDAALGEVPLNVSPLVDLAGNIQAAVAFNAAGLTLVWNFVTTAGVMTQTAVTPTSGGAYDWAAQGNGMYSIEIPASGGASINNDAEGFGWFTGVATGVLPWAGPIIGFRHAELNNSLVDVGSTGLLAPATAGRQLAVEADGMAHADVKEWLGSAPNALQSGRVDSYLGAAADAVLTAAKFASGAFDAVWSVATRELTAFSASFKTGYALSSAGVQAIWDALTSALTTVGSIGKLLVDNIDAAISSRLSTAGYTAPPSAAAVADQVWEEAIADHSGTAGSTAEQLAAAGSAGDPWATALPGSYTSGQAGKIVGDNLNATVSSRATQTSVDTIDTNVDTLLTRITSTLFAGITSLAEWLGLIAGKQAGNATARTELRATGAGSGTYDETTDSQEALRDRGDSAWTTATGFSTHNAADVWAVGTRTLTAFGTLVSDIWAAGTRTLTAFDASFKTGYALSSAGVQAIWDALTSALTTVGSIGKLLVDNINATISSRATPAQVNSEADTALADAGVTTARTAKLDGLPEGVKKNQALNNFEFLMVDSADHVTGKTGLTVTAERSVDGGAFAACANSPTELAGGVYVIDLAAADLNGTVITLMFSASGADDTVITLKTSP